MNMMDLVRQAQGGRGVENLAAQFGLSPEQTEQALSAILPSVSAGMKAKLQDPASVGLVLQKVQGTDLEEAYEDPTAAQRDDVTREGERMMHAMFDRPDVAEDVTERAGFTSGLGSTVMKAMLPVVISMVMGGMQKRTSQDSGMGGILGGLLKTAMGGGNSRSSGGLEDLIGGMLSGGQAAPARRGGGGILGSILGSLMGGGRKAAAQPAPQIQRQAPSSGGFGDLLGGMLGASPAQRASTGDRNLDGLITMFDADGDGNVDSDVLRQLQRRR